MSLRNTATSTIFALNYICGCLDTHSFVQLIAKQLTILKSMLLNSSLDLLKVSLPNDDVLDSSEVLLYTSVNSKSRLTTDQSTQGQ